MAKGFDRLVAQQCGAVFMGVKPAVLFSIRAELANKNDESLLSHWEGTEMMTMKSHAQYQLVLVYRRNLLEKVISDALVVRMLEDLGYPIRSGVLEILQTLRQRFKEGCFPHEIGFFLGYPPEDVRGFLRYQGKYSKHSCLWKVYGDVKGAMQLSSTYELCRRLYWQRYEREGKFPRWDETTKIESGAYPL